MLLQWFGIYFSCLGREFSLAFLGHDYLFIVAERCEKWKITSQFRIPGAAAFGLDTNIWLLFQILSKARYKKKKKKKKKKKEKEKEKEEEEKEEEEEEEDCCINVNFETTNICSLP